MDFDIWKDNSKKKKKKAVKKTIIISDYTSKNYNECVK